MVIGQRMLESQLMGLLYESILRQGSKIEVINLVERVVPQYRANSFESRLLSLFRM